jgi:regulator of protease activity HflC (stomatin/prohibitin superfamily)
MRGDEPRIPFGGIAIAGIVVLVVLVILFGPVYTVGAGERAVLLTWGNPGTESVGPGLHFKMPIMQSPHVMNVQTLKYEADCEAASSDLQDVKTTVAVNYHLDPAAVPIIYTNIGDSYEATIIQPKVQEIVKATTAKFTADQLISNRSSVQFKIESSLRDALRPYNIVVEGIAVTNFRFAPEFQQAIEAKARAMQERQTAEQTYQKNIIDQKSKLVELETQAKGMEAQRQTVTPEIIELRKIDAYREWISRWNGVMPQTMMGGNDLVPVFNVGGAKA